MPLTLGELKNGDIFYHEKDKSRSHKFLVFGNPRSRTDDMLSRVRNCKNMKGDVVMKMCNTEVVKVGESIYKDKIQAMFDVKK